MLDNDISKLKIDKSIDIYYSRKRRRLIYWTIIIFLLITLGFLFLKGVFSRAIEIEVTNVSRIYPSQTLTLLNASGYVVAQRKAAISSKITGRIVSIAVEEGSHVRAGQIVAKLENEDVIASKKQAEANLKVAYHNLEHARAELNDAELSFNRMKLLYEQGFVSKADYDSAEARYKKAGASVQAAEATVKASKAEIEAANVALEYTLLRAPFDAVVLTKNADIGDIVTPIGAAAEAKAAVVTIADLNSLQVEVDVSESNIHQVKVGQPCEILLDALPDLRFRGVVHMIVPTADRTKATVLVKVSFIDKDNRILPEMSAKVAFLSREIADNENKPIIAVKQDAVINRNGKNFLYLVKENRALETPIIVGRKFGDMLEVLSGVEVGDRVVLKPINKIKNGSKIKIAER